MRLKWLVIAAAIASFAGEAGAKLSLMELAKRGDAEAQYLVGVAYLEGKGLPQNPAQGIRWLRHAASQRHVGARFALGNAYLHGVGVKPNPAGAARLFREGAVDRHSESHLALAKPR